MTQKLLVIDDSRTVRKIVEWVFHGSAYEVISAATASEGERLAREHAPTVMLVDYALPDQSGFAFCKALRDNPLFQDTHLIMLGGTWGGFDQGRVAESGADDFIMKPFKADDLLNLVATVIARKAVSAPVGMPLEASSPTGHATVPPPPIVTPPTFTPASFTPPPALPISELPPPAYVTTEVDAVEDDDIIFLDEDSGEASGDEKIADIEAAFEDDAFEEDIVEDALEDDQSGDDDLIFIDEVDEVEPEADEPEATPEEDAFEADEPEADEPEAAQEEDAFEADEPEAAQEEDAFEADEPEANESLVAEAPAAPATAPAAAPVDPAVIREIVAELLPGIVQESLEEILPELVKESLGTLLNEHVFTRVQTLALSKIDRFVTDALPKIAQETIEKKLDSESN